MVDGAGTNGEATLAATRGKRHVTSPYATGSGGGTLEARIATSYLADMLLGYSRPETGGLPVVQVAFQTNPDPVDDLRVVGERDGQRFVVHVSARRRPNFVRRDTKTAKLVGDLLDQIDQFGQDEDAAVMVAFAGMTNQLRQVQELADMARLEASEKSFYEKLQMPGKYADLPGRYGHLVGLVRAARSSIESDDAARDVVFELLKRIWVRDFRLESGDETDWQAIADSLNDLAKDKLTGVEVRDKLFSVGATQFEQKGSEVDAAAVRKLLHTVLASGVGRSTFAWTQLAEEQKSAFLDVQHSLSGTVEVPREQLRERVRGKLAEAGAAGTAVIFTGESGTGKSALALSASEGLAAANAGFEFVALNLRRTRESVGALSAALGMPFADVLREMSAPSTVLVLDAADAALEGRDALLRELAGAASEAGVGLVLVAADTALADVKNALDSLYDGPSVVEVPGLDDDELRYVGSNVPAIAGALRNLPPKSLYRRLVIVDLLARTGSTLTDTLDEWECLQLIWSDLVDRTAPGKSNGEARTQTLLALSEEALQLPAGDRMYLHQDPAALDALRADRLVAPRNLTKAEANFGHDEIRRFSTAIRLAQATSLTETLLASGPIRWAMSAVKLACQGRLANAADIYAEFVHLIDDFGELGRGTRVRWKDVPLEAALEMPKAFDLLKHLLNADPDRVDDALATFIRVADVYLRYDDMVDVVRGEPVVRLVVEEVDEPWRHEDKEFRLLRDWLHSCIVDRVPVGNNTRIALRTLLLEHWILHYVPQDKRPVEVETESVYNIFERGFIDRPRRRRALPWQITNERFVELLALLGPDINDDVVACLRVIKEASPEHLQSAVDISWCAWAIASHDRHLLLELTEAYYIDPYAGRGRRYNGIRDHEFAFGRSMSGHGRGPFWVIVRFARVYEWAPVLNRILNHAAKVQCNDIDGSDSGPGPRGFTLNIDGTERTYFGDAGAWAWYRGSVNGPHPCMSALQAVERWFDEMVSAGAPVKDIVAAMLDGCENVAMVGLIFGCVARHLDKDPEVLLPYLREPLVWQFDSLRVTYDAIGFGRAPDDGVANAEMRSRSVRDIASLLVMGGNTGLRGKLKEAGEALVGNTGRFDCDESTVRRWAAALDAANMRTEPANDGYTRVTFEEPPDVEAEIAPMRAEYARYNVQLGIQNKYWIPPSRQAKWAPPTPAEVAADLAVAKDLSDNPPTMAGGDPLLAATFVAASEVKAAADGHPEAFGDHATFAITTILGVLQLHADSGEPAEDTLRFETDIGTRAAASGAVPLLALPALADHLQVAGATIDDVASAAAVLGPLAQVGACLAFARSCDTLWDHHCAGDPCVHALAYQWVLDLARVAEIGDFDYGTQHSPRLYIEGDVISRISQIRPGHLDTARLSATIRALGYASSTSACIANRANEDLATVLTAQVHAMVAQETDDPQGFRIDHNDAQTVSAARAFLHNLNLADGNYSPDSTERGPLDEYLAALVSDPHLLSAFLRDLSATGAETPQLAKTARNIWPTVVTRVLDLVEHHRGAYDTNSTRDTFVDFAVSHLLPNLEGVSEGLHSEVGHETYTWMDAGELVEFIPRWLPWAAGRNYCLFELIRFLRKLPMDRQVTDGLEWVAELCTSNVDRQLASDAVLNEWLVEVKSEADARGAGEAWLSLVDQLVSAGNRALAVYSR